MPFLIFSFLIKKLFSKIQLHMQKQKAQDS